MAVTPLTQELFDAFCAQEELGMENGQRFTVAGYDLVALATCVEGGGPPDTQEFIVLNNNSTHYLVAGRDAGATSAILIGSYEYDDKIRTPFDAYNRALWHMINEAMRH